ncbi:MAG TPA: circadian clock KaiB family protein [Blastocatellia bacterium]|jgi:circadian clock protein KaiB
MDEVLDKYLLKLYITGRTPSSERAIANLRRICEEGLASHYEMVIIDILERPQLAEDEKILATTVVIKQLPRRCGSPSAGISRLRPLHRRLRRDALHGGVDRMDARVLARGAGRRTVSMPASN